MTTFGVSMMRDEADVVEGVVRHMADEVDHLIVADNLSTDGTRDILDDLARDLPLTVVDDPDPAYRQSAKMSALAARAGAMGAKWIVPFDADEIWYSHTERLSEVFRTASGNVAPAGLFNHFPTAVDPEGKDPFRTITWRLPEPGALPKVAFRWEHGAVIHQGNHGVTLRRPKRCDLRLELRHFPYRSPEQFIRKARNGAAAYAAASEIPDHFGAHWRSYGAILDRFGEQALVDEVFRKHFWFFSPTDHGMIPDPAPYCRWQQRS